MPGGRGVCNRGNWWLSQGRDPAHPLRQSVTRDSNHRQVLSLSFRKQDKLTPLVLTPLRLTPPSPLDLPGSREQAEPRSPGRTERRRPAGPPGGARVGPSTVARCTGVRRGEQGCTGERRGAQGSGGERRGAEVPPTREGLPWTRPAPVPPSVSAEPPSCGRGGTTLADCMARGTM